jgi:aryl-alcohol dehydrogenase-like predicted oxidoreductase/histidinol phosphatase-like enzyme
MRLSTVPDRDDARSIAVIHAALDAGVRLLDTSDAYCLDDSEIGHNERLIARALATWSGDRSTVEVATKGGMKRPRGAWIAEGKAKHLKSACEASLRALGVDAIDLYQLHVVDPKTPLETSVRALATLKAEGKVKRVGLCNVTVGQVKAAREVVDIDSVQVSLSVLDDENLRNGVAEYCRDEGIRLIAHRPLGGADKVARLARDPVLADVAARHDVTSQTIALAWLMDLGTVPIPGATRVETATSIRDALAVRLGDEDRRALDAAFSGRLLRVPRSERRPKPGADGDVVLVMGMPAAGKSGIAREFVELGYERLNRDQRGGTLSGLVEVLDQGLAAGRKRWVLDNTYPARKQRNEVIECAWKHGVPVRCIHLTTSVPDAQINAITRLIAIHGRLPMPEELRERGKEDPRYFGPDAQFRYERSVELPDEDEGFASIETRAFGRLPHDAATARAVFMEYDDVLVTNASGAGPALRPEDIALAEGAREALQRLHGEGWLLFAQAWRPQIARGEATRDAVEACFARTRELLGMEIALVFCSHDAGPPICWCRKPLPGLILEYALSRRVNVNQSIYVGRVSADRTLAQRLGLRYEEDLATLGLRAANRR